VGDGNNVLHDLALAAAQMGEARTRQMGGVGAGGLCMRMRSRMGMVVRMRTLMMVVTRR
jgi:hypothetical protein